MIKVGDVLTIKGYDYDKMCETKRQFVVLDIYPHFVLCKHKKAGYRECFSAFELIENGYIPNFEDVKEKEGYMVNLDRYVSGNKLLDEGYCI